MTYFLFFYNIVICFVTLCLCSVYAVLFRSTSERSYLYGSLLFGLYFLDILVLYMYDSIPEFGEAFNGLLTTAPYVYWILGYGMLLSYRLIFGSIFKKPFSRFEAICWITCIIGGLVSWFVPDPYWSSKVNWAFTITIRTWVLIFALLGLRSQWKQLDTFFLVTLITLIAIFALCETADSIYAFGGLIAADEPLREIPMEILGASWMIAAIAYLVYYRNAQRTNDRATMFSHIASRYNLTKRETEMLQFIADDLSYRQIGEQEFISVGTVKVHAHNLFVKLGLEGRSEISNFLKQELRAYQRRRPRK